MHFKNYYLLLCFFILIGTNVHAQNYTKTIPLTSQDQACKSEFVHEGEGTTTNYFDVQISLEPVPEYYERNYFLNRLFKTEGLYFQSVLENNILSFLISRELYSEIPVLLISDLYDEAGNNENILTANEKADYLSMYEFSLPGLELKNTDGTLLYGKGSRDNATCEAAIPFCTGTNYTFPAGVNSGNGQVGPDYDCLSSTPNPAWYYMKILDPGSINIYMYSTPSKDIDFCCWGPFDDPYDACSQLTGNKVVSCSYSPNASETCNIPSGQTGEYYILIITNYSQAACNINFSQTGGTGTTDCTILPPEASSNSPVCDGDDIELYAASQNGASYHWVGPSSFSSTEQNPIIENATSANSGPYTLTITQAAGSSDTTFMVYVKGHPTGNIYGDSEVCKGESAYIFFDLTGDSPWDIKYTDGTNIYEESTFLNAYTLQVAPNSTANYTLVEVKDEFCYAEEMTGEAIVTIHPTIQTLNLETDCNSAFTEYTVSFLITGGNTGTYEVVPPGDITPGPTAIFTSNPIPEGTPFEFAVTDDFNCDPTIVSGIKDCDCPAYGEIIGADTICSGESVDIMIDLSGDAPWSISYAANGGTPVTITDIMSSPYYLSVSPTETTEYSLTNVGDQYCDGTAVGKATIFVHPQPISLYSFSGICESEETAFTNESSISTSGNIVSYLYDFNDGGATSTDENPIHTFSTYGDFDVSLSVTSEKGCVDIYTETIAVAQKVNVDAGADQTIDYGTYTTLEGAATGGSSDYSYSWSPSEFVVDPSDPASATTNLYDDTYFTLTVTDNISGCVGVSFVEVILDGYPLSSAPESSPSQACYNTGIQLSANEFGGTENYTYSWTSIPAGYTFSIANPAIEQLSESTTFYVEINDGFNTVTESVFVPVNPNPVISAGEDMSIVYGYKTQLNCTTNGGGSTFSYYWTPEDKIDDNPYAKNPLTINMEEETHFTVSATNEFGCVAEDGVVVTVDGGPLNAVPWVEEEKICNLDTIVLHNGATGGGGGYTYAWSVSPGTWTSSEAEPEVILMDAGTYTYSVSVSDLYNSYDGSLVMEINALPHVDLTAQFDSIVDNSTNLVAVCIFDSTYLDAGNPGAEYLWSNGSTDQVIYVGSTGIGYDVQDYSVRITDKITECSTINDISIVYSFSMCTYSIDELNGQVLDVSIYPNPVSEQLQLSVDGVTKDTRIVITDISGRQQVFNTLIPANTQHFEQKIDFNTLPVGIYLIRFSSGNYSHTEKVIKMNN